MTDTVKVRYVGPQREVNVQTAPEKAVRVKRNHQVELPAEIAEGLLVQTDDWKPVAATPPARRSSTKRKRKATPPTADAGETLDAPPADKGGEEPPADGEQDPDAHTGNDDGWTE